MMKGVLLDTHVWIWLMNGDETLSPHQKKMIYTAAEETMIGIAAISVWELAMLVKKIRVKLKKPIHDWIRESLSLPGMYLQPLTPEISIESTQLPESFHGDPADRLIVATARVNQLMLITHDQKILEYAKKKYVMVSKK